MLCDTHSDIAAARERGTDALVGVMARILAEKRRTDGCVTEGDLCAAGFTREEVSLYSARARDRAASSSAERRSRDRDRLDAELTAELAGMARLTTTIEASLARLKAGLERVAGRVG